MPREESLTIESKDGVLFDTTGMPSFLGLLRAIRYKNETNHRQREASPSALLLLSLGLAKKKNADFAWPAASKSFLARFKKGESWQEAIENSGAKVLPEYFNEISDAWGSSTRFAKFQQTSKDGRPSGKNSDGEDVTELLIEEIDNLQDKANEKLLKVIENQIYALAAELGASAGENNLELLRYGILRNYLGFSSEEAKRKSGASKEVVEKVRGADLTGHGKSNFLVAGALFGVFGLWLLFPKLVK